MHSKLRNEIRKVSEQIASDFHPDKIILFGSYAYGRPGPASDVDLLVIMQFRGRPVRQAIAILNKLNVLTPIDLLVRTPEQVQERLAFAQREFRARKNPSYDAACFHSQQCAEKYLKARLEEAGLAFTKTHNLVALLALALQVEPLWATLHPRLNALNSFAVAYRYPGASANKADARNAVRDCQEVRRLARQALRLP